MLKLQYRERLDGYLLKQKMQLQSLCIEGDTSGKWKKGGEKCVRKIPKTGQGERRSPHGGAR